MCNHCHSLVDFAVSGCRKSWSETTEEGFTFPCLRCWKVDCLTAELARLTDIVKVMERGGRMIARKPKWRKKNRQHGMQEDDRGETDSREGGRDQRTGDERSGCDRRKDEGKKGSER